MIEQSIKSVSKSDTRSETDKKKVRIASTSGCGCSKLAQLRSNSKLSSGHFPSDASQLSLERACQRHRLRMKLLKTRNAAEETSEGVQQFIRHVSSFIEKKNPFKDKVLYPSEKSGKSLPPDSLDSIQFHGTSKTSQEDQSGKGSDDGSEDALLEELKAKSFEELQKVLESVPQEGTGGLVKSERDRNAQKESSSDAKKSPELSQTKKKGSRWHFETRRWNGVAPGKTPDSGRRRSSTPNTNKTKKPSEIPLRKNRTGSAKTRKQSPQTSKRQEKLNYYDIYAVNKSLSPLDEFSVCSGFQTASNAASSEDQTSTDEKSPFSLTKEPSEVETNSKKKETLFKGPSTPAAYSNEFLEGHSRGAKEFKVVDLNKMKTTSFTILQAENILDRLQPLDEIKEREKSSDGKCIATTPRTKPTMKTVTGKSSRKNLSRTSSKGSKLALRMKAKKSKKEINLAKKEKHKKGEKSIRECLESGKAWWENRKPGTSGGKPEAQKETGVFHVPVKLVRTRAKSFLRGVDTPKEKDWSGKTSDLLSQVNFDDFQLETSKPENAILGVPDEEVQTIKDYKFEERNTQTEVAPPQTPGDVGKQTKCTEGEEVGVSPSKAMVFIEKVKADDFTPESETRKNSPENSVKFSESFEKSEAPESEDLPKMKTRIRIDLKPTENILKFKTIDDDVENSELFDWLFLSKKNYEDKSSCLQDSVVQTSNSESGTTAEETVKSKQDVAVEVVSSELAEEPGPLNVAIQKPQKSCSSLKRRRGEDRRLYKSSEGANKPSRKKKIRSDAGGRRLPSPTGFFNSDITLLGKAVPDTRQRSGLTRSYSRDEKRDVFEDAAPVKLKRRSSEPFSLRGYVWKCADTAAARGHKPSVSSMASSLRHLNTDDIDDFTFWEAVPQRKTAWETSLYHFKRPWSVLSCSVFKDNRRSSTPGLILENLRNGGALRRFTASENERLRCRKENPFDVEPSIAQKNIDIRNWLAALNFPMLPSTSSDFLGESNFVMQSTSEAQNRNKIQTTPRRRKVIISSFKEPPEKRCEEMEKLKKSSILSGSDPESLTELTRRISGGFPSKDQLMSSEHSIRRPNAALNLCIYSKFRGESFLEEIAEPRKPKTFDEAMQPQAAADGSSAGGDQTLEKRPLKPDPSPARWWDPKTVWKTFPKEELARAVSGLNVWKYLFMLTMFILAVHHFLSG